MSWASFAEGVGGSFGGRLFDRVADDIFGIPGPSGSELGKRSLDYFNAAFPGTNPWERLGSPSPASSMVAADAAQRTANRQHATSVRIKKDELETSERNVDKQTKTQDEVSRRDLAGKIIQADAQENSARIMASGQQAASNVSGSWSFQGAKEAADAARYGADVGASANVQSSRIHAQAMETAADIGAKATLDAAGVQADASMFSSVMMTGDPSLISNYFEESGRNPDSIAYTLRSEEVGAKLEKISNENMALIIDNFINSEKLAFAAAMAKAELTQKQTQGLWTTLENFAQGHLSTELDMYLYLAGAGAATAGVARLVRMFAKNKKVEQMKKMSDGSLNDKLSGRRSARETTTTTSTTSPDAVGRSWRWLRSKFWWNRK